MKETPLDQNIKTGRDGRESYQMQLATIYPTGFVALTSDEQGNRSQSAMLSLKSLQ